MKIGIYGYGNLGKGVEVSILQNKDMELFGIFSRRNPESVKTLTGAKVFSADDILKYKNDIPLLFPAIRLGSFDNCTQAIDRILEVKRKQLETLKKHKQS